MINEARLKSEPNRKYDFNDDEKRRKAAHYNESDHVSTLSARLNFN